MFVYAIKISGLPTEVDAKSILDQYFPDNTSNSSVSIGDQLTIYQPVQNGELYFSEVLQTMGESFAKLSEQNWQFFVLRKRHNGKYKLVANYDDNLRVGQRTWRDECQRIDAASESFASFLSEEATAEDMEVLRPLFPKRINRLLRKKEKHVTAGAELLQKSCPTLNTEDSRHIFQQMQRLQASRASKWKNRLGCAWVSLYFIISVFLMYAIADGLISGLSWHALIAAPIAMIIALLPIIGSIAASMSALHVWEWSTGMSILAFFWYYLPIAYIIVRIGFAAFKGEGVATWNKILNKQNDSVDD